MAKKRKRKNQGGIWILLLLTVILVVVALTTPIFNIRFVTITGYQRLAEEEIRKAANIPPEKNIFLVSTKRIAQQVETLTYVKEAKVKRRIPDKITISVTERVETASIKAGGGYAIIDDTGHVLRLALGEEDILCFSGCTVNRAEEGKLLELDEEHHLSMYLSVRDNLFAVGLEGKIKTISIDDIGEIKAVTRGGMQIYLGTIDDIAYKAELVGKILGDGYPELNADCGGVLRWTSEGNFSYRQNEN